ncbi:ribose-5-phosphate isomerase RpiA [Caldibacillus lycopersici]|uniref:Ribose-5-phosphate isomerase A n=1 Tax=Perspicuibacillus lycopersici TaxID=1325689 RepID=A0AAE3IQ64_9BACI|nr:ribose-5-phosphate isomerase RpiA [Perspicuibacillus lycopersici]MCU9612376.1 ribose-5-phosphate isomerase RpiA [Perspicuibacillus lycopersici]
MNEKQLVGEKAVEYVRDGMIVGLGTGSTAYYAIQKLGQLVQAGLSIKGVPTSVQTENLAKELKIPLTTFTEVDYLDIAIDGADEVDQQQNLIKGGGGALLREKIIARAAKQFIVIADSSKMVNTLGTFPLPVEVTQFGHKVTKSHIEALGGKATLRQMDGEIFISDNGNYIYDVKFENIMDAKELEQALNLIPGVVENGLFVHMADKVITVDKNKQIVIR